MDATADAVVYGHAACFVRIRFVSISAHSEIGSYWIRQWDQLLFFAQDHKRKRFEIIPWVAASPRVRPVRVPHRDRRGIRLDPLDPQMRSYQRPLGPK